MARGDIPRITWGAAFVNTLEVGYPLDSALSYADPRPEQEVSRVASGTEDAWVIGDDYILEGDARWIPAANGTTPAGDTITGWDGSTGWRAFLAWARQANQFRFIPSKAVPGTYILSSLVEPMMGPPTLEDADLTKRMRLKIRNVSSEYAGY